MSTDDYTAYVEGAWPRLFRTAYALTGDVAAADDLLQGTLVKVYVHWRKVRRADAPDAYVRRIMLNQAASTWRGKGRRPEVLSPEPRPEIEAGAAFDGDLAEQDALWRVVHTLPPRQRAVVVLRYYEDLSEHEISDVLGIAPGTVKSLASAALTKLRARLAETGNVTTTGGNR